MRNRENWEKEVEIIRKRPLSQMRNKGCQVCLQIYGWNDQTRFHFSKYVSFQFQISVILEIAKWRSDSSLHCSKERRALASNAHARHLFSINFLAIFLTRLEPSSLPFIPWFNLTSFSLWQGPEMMQESVLISTHMKKCNWTTNTMISRSVWVYTHTELAWKVLSIEDSPEMGHLQGKLPSFVYVYTCIYNSFISPFWLHKIKKNNGKYFLALKKTEDKQILTRQSETVQYMSTSDRSVFNLKITRFHTWWQEESHRKPFDWRHKLSQTQRDIPKKLELLQNITQR